MPSELIPTMQVVDRLGFPEGTFRDISKRAQGFPQPARSGRLLMWDWAAVHAWFEGHPRVTPVDRFFASISPGEDWYDDGVVRTRCLEWTGAVDGAGYGRWRSGQRKSPMLTHRWLYERWVGPIQEGLTIDHLCRNRRCCNPKHLEPVTPRENILRGYGTGAINKRKTHCKRGHEFTPDNIYLVSNGKGCRVCKTLHAAAYRAGTTLKKIEEQ